MPLAVSPLNTARKQYRPGSVTVTVSETAVAGYRYGISEGDRPADSRATSGAQSGASRPGTGRRPRCPPGVAVPPVTLTTAESLTLTPVGRGQTAGRDDPTGSLSAASSPWSRCNCRSRRGHKDRVLVVRGVGVAGHRARDDVREGPARRGAAEDRGRQVDRGLAPESVLHCTGLARPSCRGASGSLRVRLSPVPLQFADPEVRAVALLIPEDHEVAGPRLSQGLHPAISCASVAVP